MKYLWALILLMLLSACASENQHCYTTPIMQANGQVKNVVTSCD